MNRSLIVPMVLVVVLSAASGGFAYQAKVQPDLAPADYNQGDQDKSN
jgi:hypothetical protein